jgi:hypothetical protein
VGSRGPARDIATDARILEIIAQLEDWGFYAGNAAVAVALSFEREERVTVDAVKARRKRLPR